MGRAAQEILLRLRTSDLRGFRPYHSIRETLVTAARPGRRGSTPAPFLSRPRFPPLSFPLSISRLAHLLLLFLYRFAPPAPRPCPAAFPRRSWTK